MITAVDTNVLLDIFVGDAHFGPNSRLSLRESLATGVVVACDVVWAEVTAAFPDTRSAGQALDDLGIECRPLSRAEAATAGQAWREYRRAGGPRQRVVSDFLIAAHAAAMADRLLTRDRGFYRTYFATPAIVDPSA